MIHTPIHVMFLSHYLYINISNIIIIFTQVMLHIWEGIAIFNDIACSENKTGLQKNKFPNQGILQKNKACLVIYD